MAKMFTYAVILATCWSDVLGQDFYEAAVPYSPTGNGPRHPEDSVFKSEEKHHQHNHEIDSYAHGGEEHYEEQNLDEYHFDPTATSSYPQSDENLYKVGQAGEHYSEQEELISNAGNFEFVDDIKYLSPSPEEDFLLINQGAFFYPHRRRRDLTETEPEPEPEPNSEVEEANNQRDDRARGQQTGNGNARNIHQAPIDGLEYLTVEDLGEFPTVPAKNNANEQQSSTDQINSYIQDFVSLQRRNASHHLDLQRRPPRN